MTRRQREWLLPPAVLFLAAGILLGRETAVSLWAWIGFALALCAVFLLRGRLRFAAVLAAVLALGTAAGSMAWHPALPAEGEYEIRGIVADEVRRGSFGQVKTTLTGLSLNGEPYASGGYWSFYTEEDLPEGLVPGCEVSFTGTLYAPSGAENPDGYDFREELLRQGVTVGLYGSGNLSVGPPTRFSFAGWTASLRHELSCRLVETLGEESGSYASALLLGNRSMISSEDRADFARLGIAHILSVSGFHVGILVGMLAFLFRLLRLPQQLRLGLYAFLLLLYCALCGMSQPVIRASLLLLVTLGGRLLNRPRSGLHLLCAVLFVMLLWSPVQLTGVSFLLTFGAMLGIVLLLPTFQRRNPFRRSKPLRSLWSSFSVMTAAQLGVLLPELYFYQKLPLLGLLVNVPATFVASLLIALYWIILLLLPIRPLAGLLAVPGSAVTSFLLSCVRSLADLPGITLWTHASTWLTVLGIILVFAALCSMLRLRRWVRLPAFLVGVLLVVLSLCPWPHSGTEYIQFSVGNADAAVLWDENQVVVVDAGTDDGVVSGFLRRRRLVPDAVILTHLHTDHAGGLKSLLDDEIPIPLLYLPAGAEEQQIHEDVLALLDQLRQSGTEIRTLSRGDEIPLPSGNIRVLWPVAGKTRRNQDANHYSLVALFSLDGVSFLHTGDISGEYEMYSAVPADLLKASHHGSPNSTSPEFMQEVSPTAVLLSCNSLSRDLDFDNRTGDVPVWSTAAHGALTVRFSQGTFTVVPYLP